MFSFGNRKCSVDFYGSFLTHDRKRLSDQPEIEMSWKDFGVLSLIHHVLRRSHLVINMFWVARISKVDFSAIIFSKNKVDIRLGNLW